MKIGLDDVDCFLEPRRRNRTPGKTKRPFQRVMSHQDQDQEIQETLEEFEDEREETERWHRRSQTNNIPGLTERELIDYAIMLSTESQPGVQSQSLDNLTSSSWAGRSLDDFGDDDENHYDFDDLDEEEQLNGSPFTEDYYE